MGRLLVRMLGVAAVLVACTSPTLPLPPPALPTISTSAQADSFHLKSERGTIANALVVTVSRNTTLTPEQRVNGTIADGDGSWEMDVIGQPGDIVDISQESGSERSAPVSITLPPR